jgi:hypothetical protein
MPVKTSPKYCLACDNVLKGRADKKYCDDFCRNTYNNDLKVIENNNYIRNINNALKSNRRILKEMLDNVAPEEKLTLAKPRLVQAGFNFKYITHTYTNKKENMYFFCYDYGYMHLEGDRCLIVRRREG